MGDAPSSQASRRARWPRLTQAAFVAGAAVLWLVFSASVVNPVVVNDEVLFLLTGVAGPHLAEARAMQAAVQESGALLYPALISALVRTGAPPEAAIKLLNVAAFLGGALLLSRLSAGLEDGRRSRLLGAWLLVAPLGTYAAYIMPECLYFLLFAGVVAVLVGGRGEADRPLARAAAAGGLVALMTLTKPHGLVALAALEAAFLGRLLLRPGRRETLAKAGVALAGFAAVFLVGRWATTPPGASAGGDLLGGAYRAQLAYVAAGPEHALAAAGLSLRYLLAILALWAPGLVMLAAHAFGRRRADETAARDRARFAAQMVLWLLGLLLVFVPLVVTSEADRIHLRYLVFAVPAALALAARLSPAKEPPGRLRLAAAVWAAAAVACAAGLAGYRPLAADAPDLFFLHRGEFGAFGLGPFTGAFLLIVVLAGAATLASGRVRWTTVQAAVLLVFAAVAVPNCLGFTKAMERANAPDRAVGKAAAALCGRGPGDVIALGEPLNFVQLYQALYVLKRPVPLLLPKPSASQLQLARTPPGACVLTTLVADGPRLRLLAASPAVRLYRAR